MMRIHVPIPPAGLHSALEKKDLRYTEALCFYQCVALGDVDSYCGVFGDGDNGAYEWFVWRRGALETSNVGYGSPEAALRDVLTNEVPR